MNTATNDLTVDGDELRTQIETEIAAIYACSHCGGKSEGDQGRIVALQWVLDALPNLSARREGARLYDHRNREGQWR